MLVDDFITQSRLLTRIQAIITHLVFEHALRRRMKADVMDDAGQSGDTTLAGTPETASVAESSATAQEQIARAEDNNGRGSTSPNAGKGKQKAVPQEASKTKVIGREDKPKPAGDEKKGKNVVGKINNLVTTDLNNLSDGRDFLFIGVWLSEMSRCLY